MLSLDGFAVHPKGPEARAKRRLKAEAGQARSSLRRSESSRLVRRSQFHPEAHRRVFHYGGHAPPADALADAHKGGAKGSTPSPTDDGMHYVRVSPGAAKSAVAKATGNTAGIPTIAFDLGAMQSSLVGGSGERLRSALKVVDAVSQGRALFIATCNSIASLPPELRRRFTLGTFFFDLPSADEREAIWRIYEKKYSVSGERPDDEGWTGAEIKECCRKAGRLRLPLVRAAQYTVPISKSAAEQIKSLRQQASGKFISASSTGVYRYEETATAPTATTRRIRSVEA